MFQSELNMIRRMFIASTERDANLGSVYHKELLLELKRLYAIEEGLTALMPKVETYNGCDCDWDQKTCDLST